MINEVEREKIVVSIRDQVAKQFCVPKSKVHCGFISAEYPYGFEVRSITGSEKIHASVCVYYYNKNNDYCVDFSRYDRDNKTAKPSFERVSTVNVTVAERQEARAEAKRREEVRMRYARVASNKSGSVNHAMLFSDYCKEQGI